MEHGSPRGFEIVFHSSPKLRDVVRVSPHVSLPPPSTPTVDPTLREREERKTIEQVLEQLSKSAKQFAAGYQGMIEEMRQAAIELATAVAGRVVFEKLEAGEFPIEEMVRQALARLPAAPTIRVYLHPEDLSALQRRLVDKPLLPARETQIRVEADASLRRGGCRAEAGDIHVLADLADNLVGLRQHLLWSASHAQSGSSSDAP